MTSDSNNKIQETHDKYTDAYVRILDTYKEQISLSVDKKNKLKESFFNAIEKIMRSLTWVFAGTLGLSLVLFGIMILINYNSIGVLTGAITTIISSFATMIISIFKLPQIIADYLFNKEEDQLMNQIIKNIQVYEIDAVKYDIEKVKLEKLKQLNSGVSSTNASDNDNDLANFVYDIPSQSQDNQSENTDSENSAP